jgi:hypothetical protein
MRNVKKFSLPGIGPRLFINIVEASKFPAAFGQFKNEANRCVFPVVWSSLKRTVDVIFPVGFFVRFRLSKTLRCIGLAFENFAIPARETLLVLYGFYLIGHRQRKLRHVCDRGFIASDDRGFKFLPECRKVGLGKRIWKRQQNQNPC